MNIDDNTVHFIRVALNKIAANAERDAAEARTLEDFRHETVLRGVASQIREVLTAVPATE